MPGIADRVARRHLARIVLRDLRGPLQVSGTPEEMNGLMRELRSLGFRFDPLRRVWQAEGLTDQKRRNLERLIAWYTKKQSDPMMNSDWSSMLIDLGGL